MDYTQLAEILTSGGATGIVIIMYIVDIRTIKKSVEDIDRKIDTIMNKKCDKDSNITIKDLLPLLDRINDGSTQDDDGE